MKRSITRRLSLEALEDRCCPSVTAHLTGGGTLMIRGSSADLQITQTAAGSFDVVDAGVSQSFSGVNSLHVKLGADNDVVTLDLGGFTGPDALDRVRIQLGAGDNQLTIANGEVGRSLRVQGGGGIDQVSLLDSLRVNGDLTVHLFAGDDVADVAAEVGGRARFFLGSGNDTLTFAGEVGTGRGGDRLQVKGANGDDVVTLTAEAVLNGRGTVHLGSGNDTFALEVTEPLDLRAFGGGGQDTFEGDATLLSRPPVGFESFADEGNVLPE
ncbi:MAG TPA: hypothetical protein VNK04_06965 [Gemmataceae bacterium]|nr:hypothetical protein [Gemmataceae bacterium]